MAQISGVWKWNFRVDTLNYVGEEVSAEVNFESNGGTFSNLKIYCSAANSSPLGVNYDNIEVRSLSTEQLENGEWQTTATFRTEYIEMNFGKELQEIPDDVYKILVENAECYGDQFAELIEIIAENEQKVYDAGVDAGKQAEYDAFWDAKQPGKGMAMSMTGCFGGYWTADTFRPKYDVVPTYAQFMFYANGLNIDLVEHMKSIGRKLDFSQCKNMAYAFTASAFTHLGSICGNGVGNSYVFQSCKKLVTIDEFGHCDGGDISTDTTATFEGCTALENITIKGKFTGNIYFHWSKNLSKASIISIINALSDNVSGKKLQLSETAIKSAFNAEPMDWDGDGKKEGWIGPQEWLDLMSSKSNWTITALDV